MDPAPKPPAGEERKPAPKPETPAASPAEAAPAPAGPAAPAPAAAAPAAAATAAADPLAEVPLFGGSPADLLKKLESESEFVVYARGATIFEQGEFTADFYVVLDGAVGVYRIDKSGQFEPIAILSRHAWFGEMSALSNSPRTLTAVCESEVVALKVPRHAFEKIYRDKRAAEFRRQIDEHYRARVLQGLLKNMSLLRGLPDEMLRAIGESSLLEVAEPGAGVVKEGDPAKDFYVVRTGNLKVVTKGEDGREKLLAYLSDNSWFGEVALLKSAPRTSSVVAITRCDLVRIPAAAFQATLERSPGFKQLLIDRIAEWSAKKVGEEGAARGDSGLELMLKRDYVKAGMALVIDRSKCTHCNLCIEGCIEAHDDGIPRIGKRGINYGDLLLTSSCFNCRVPECMLSCKFGSITRARDGQVHIDAWSCTGCRLCEPACPYGTIHIEELAAAAEKPAAPPRWKRWAAKIPLLVELLSDDPLPAAPSNPSGPAAGPGAGPAGMKRTPKALAVKCDFCAERGDQACIYNCPCGAIERMDPRALLG
jgi:CRP-like cAMP-binding protein/Fe-S-cluster-containing dehydrogenase component